MQIDNSRIHYTSSQNEKHSIESIPLELLHGSPYHVFPVSIPAVKAFQDPNLTWRNSYASPLLSKKLETESSENVQQINLQARKLAQFPKRQNIQETSFMSSTNTDAIVAKINNMFPTASENHIRLLLKKYYNREAVVISALQVEKHPVTMPGPFATPPAQRHLFNNNSFYGTPVHHFERISRTVTPPVAKTASSTWKPGEYHSSPKPHSSPKMKLRYLKNIFPKADETILLDILANSDNNVQEASETLLTLGYTKREVSATRNLNRFEEKKNIDSENKEKLRSKILTVDDKYNIKNRLQNKYANIAERIILMALDSVNYSEDRASQILQIVLLEDENKAKQKLIENENENTFSAEEKCDLKSINVYETRQLAKASESKQLISSDATFPSPSPEKVIQKQQITSLLTTSTFSRSPQLKNVIGFQNRSFMKDGISKFEKRSKMKSELLNGSPKGSMEDENSINELQFKSILSRIRTSGPNSELRNGPNDDLLLADYVTWNGANPEIYNGERIIAVGSNPSLLGERSYYPRGHNEEYCKGPQRLLSKGSIYLNRNAITKCN